GAVIDHLEKDRPALERDAAERADDGVVNELGDLTGLDRLGPVGVENLQEVPEPFAFRLEPEFLVLGQRFAIEYGVVVERNAVQAQVGTEVALVGLAIDMTTLDVVEGRGAEGQRRMRGVFAAAHNVNVGGVVDARGRRYVTLFDG